MYTVVMEQRFLYGYSRDHGTIKTYSEPYQTSKTKFFEDYLCKSVEWFLYGRDRHERVNIFFTIFDALKHVRIRSSHPEVFLRKGVLKICSKFTKEHPCQNVISIKLILQLY